MKCNNIQTRAQMNLFSAGLSVKAKIKWIIVFCDATPCNLTDVWEEHTASIFRAG
jgi:hypothetical protein